MDNIDLTIIIPAYYENENIQFLYKKLIKVLDKINYVWEIIIVDDGSKDQTWSNIMALHNNDSRVKGIRFSRNFGHQYALFAAFSYSKGKAIITMDADLQHPPEAIPELLAEWEKGNKIINTLRIDHEKISFFKKMTSNLFYRIFSFLSGERLNPGMADFRLLDRQVVNEIIKFRESGLFLRGIVNSLGYANSIVKFQCGNRLYGKSKYTLRKMIKFAWNGITSFSLKPLRLGIFLGILTSLFAFYELVEALIAYYSGKTVPGWTSVIVIITFLFGMLFIIIGIVGEYIGRILIEVRDRPRFIIGEKIGL